MAFGAIFYFRKLPQWSLPLCVMGLFVAAFNLTDGMLAYTWALGSLAALVWAKLPQAPWRVIFLVCLGLSIHRYQLATEEFYDLRLNLLIGLTMFSALKAIEGMQFPKWLAKASAGLAAYSYTLYLTHYIVMLAPFDLSPALGIAVAIVASNFVAIILYFAFERHYRKVGGWLRSVLLSPQSKPSSYR